MKSFINRPIPRLLRYELLLKGILDETQSGHDDRVAIPEVLDVIKSLGKETEPGVASAKQKVASLKVVLDRVEQAQQAASKLSLADLHHIYSQLQQDHPAEYIMYDLPAIALTQVPNAH